MFQKFNQDTLGSRFIKSLLAQTPIPTFDSVVKGDYIVKDCYYVYGPDIIRCTNNGELNSNYIRVNLSQRYDPKYFSCYDSSKTYYDSETHYQLGRYLRYLRTTENINLLPFYNVYSAKTIPDVELNKQSDGTVSISRAIKQKNKVVAVPIRAFHSYTLAFDCPTEVLLRACVYDDSGYIVEASSENSFMTPSIISILNESGKVLLNSRFHFPTSYELGTPSEADLSSLVKLQKNLYLLIQLPSTNTSSIVVLEDTDTRKGIYCTHKDGGQIPLLFNSSLLSMNAYCSYAFSDRLIEYLLGNVIFKNEQLSDNIAKVQTILSNHNDAYRRSFINKTNLKGIWDNDIERITLRLVKEYAKDHIIYDQDGSINKDVETLLVDKGAAY